MPALLGLPAQSITSGIRNRNLACHAVVILNEVFFVGMILGGPNRRLSDVIKRA